MNINLSIKVENICLILSDVYGYLFHFALKTFRVFYHPNIKHTYFIFIKTKSSHNQSNMLTISKKFKR